MKCFNFIEIYDYHTALTMLHVMMTWVLLEHIPIIHKGALLQMPRSHLDLHGLWKGL